MSIKILKLLFFTLTLLFTDGIHFALAEGSGTRGGGDTCRIEFKGLVPEAFDWMKRNRSLIQMNYPIIAAKLNIEEYKKRALALTIDCILPRPDDNGTLVRDENGNPVTAFTDSSKNTTKIAAPNWANDSYVKRIEITMHEGLVLIGVETTLSTPISSLYSRLANHDIRAVDSSVTKDKNSSYWKTLADREYSAIEIMNNDPCKSLDTDMLKGWALPHRRSFNVPGALAWPTSGVWTADLESIWDQKNTYYDWVRYATLPKQSGKFQGIDFGSAEALGIVCVNESESTFPIAMMDSLATNSNGYSCTHTEVLRNGQVTERIQNVSDLPCVVSALDSVNIVDQVSLNKLNETEGGLLWAVDKNNFSQVPNSTFDKAALSWWSADDELNSDQLLTCNKPISSPRLTLHGPQRNLAIRLLNSSGQYPLLSEEDWNNAVCTRSSDETYLKNFRMLKNLEEQ